MPFPKLERMLGKLATLPASWQDISNFPRFYWDRGPYTSQESSVQGTGPATTSPQKELKMAPLSEDSSLTGRPTINKQHRAPQRGPHAGGGVRNKHGPAWSGAYTSSRQRPVCLAPLKGLVSGGWKYRGQPPAGYSSLRERGNQDRGSCC